MKLKYDFNNMLEGKVDVASQHPSFQKKVGAITREDLEKAMPALEKARRSIARKWGRPSKMMAWAKLPYNQKTVVKDILAAAQSIRRNFTHLVVFGIGGSALGPIAVQQALNHLRYNELPDDKRGGPKLYVEDNVDPERMAALLDVVELDKTCFIIITKSGGTSETMAQTLIAFDLLKRTLGEGAIARQVIAVTDKAKGNLAKIAAEYGLKKFVVPDGVGGRFSELCPVGLLPAAVCGIDIEELLAGAAYMDELCREEDLTKNLGYMAGLISYLSMKKGKNIQVFIPYSDALKYMSDWFAQLWAESLGKKYSLRGKVVHTGQTPVKALGVTDQHSQVQLYAEGPFDKVITFLGVGDYRTTYAIPGGFDDMPSVSFLSGHTLNELIQSEQYATEMSLTHAGKLNQTITLPEVNAFTLGQLMFFQQVQTTVCGELLGIDAFDQPGVEEGKINTYALLGRPGFEEEKKALDAQQKKEAQYIL
ncbi:MAG: glucose-6-phosphate isomerase [Eubacteriales bacterium]|nr:glucose-6-phosphate isomerase [Eubacteriales bacterium]